MNEGLHRDRTGDPYLVYGLGLRRLPSLEIDLSASTDCPCGSNLAYGHCCFEPVAYVRRRIVQTLSDAIPAWDRIDLPLESLALLAGLKPGVGEHPPTVEDITEATDWLMQGLIDYPEGIKELDEGLRELLRESGIRLPADSLTDILIDGVIDGAGDEALRSTDEAADLIRRCVEPHLTEVFVERIYWHLLFRGRREGTGARVLAAVLWGLWNLHQDLPISENAVWDGLFRVSLDDLWNGVVADAPGIEDSEGATAITGEVARREDIVDLRERSEAAVRALARGTLSFRLPLFSVINGALRMRRLMSDPDYPGYDALFDSREWQPWGQHPITAHMKNSMRKDWRYFLPAFESTLDRWLEEAGERDERFVASVLSMFALLECHGLPELDDVLAVIYTSCVRDVLADEDADPGVEAIIEEDYADLLRYATDLHEWGRPEAARHVRLALLHRTPGSH